jgi:hypothetical protein
MHKTYNLLKTVISICCILLLALPFCEIYTGTMEEDLGWQNSYIMGDTDSIIICLPFIILWFVHYFIKRILLKKIIAVILPLLSIQCSYIGISIIRMPIQDLMPAYGSFIAIILLPLLVAHFFLTFLVEE